MLNISVTCDWCGITEDLVMFSAEEPAEWTMPPWGADEDRRTIFEAAEENFIGDIESEPTLCPECSHHVVRNEQGDLAALDAEGQRRENLFVKD